MNISDVTCECPRFKNIRKQQKKVHKLFKFLTKKKQQKKWKKISYDRI